MGEKSRNDRRGHEEDLGVLDTSPVGRWVRPSKEYRMRYELVVVWDTGEKNVYQYETEAEAEAAGHNMKMALGNQIAWYGTRRA